MNIAALGTAISFAKFIFLPRGGKGDVKPGFWAAIILLIGGLILANIVYYEAYTVANIIKPLATIGVGWLAYLLIFKHSVLKLPRVLEQFDHLIGVMSLILILLFWKGFAWLGI
jgi:multicomponent Na+:H+ antiporter subunit D